MESLTTHLRGAQLRTRPGRHVLAPSIEDSINDDIFQQENENDDQYGGAHEPRGGISATTATSIHMLEYPGSWSSDKPA